LVPLLLQLLLRLLLWLLMHLHLHLWLLYLLHLLLLLPQRRRRRRSGRLLVRVTEQVLHPGPTRNGNARGALRPLPMLRARPHQ
jgi:hypothetical protein